MRIDLETLLEGALAALLVGAIAGYLFGRKERQSASEEYTRVHILPGPFSATKEST